MPRGQHPAGRKIFFDPLFSENVSKNTAFFFKCLILSDALYTGMIYDQENTVRLLVPGHFYFYAVSKVLLRANDIYVLLL